MANLVAQSVAHLRITQAEFEFDRGTLEAFITGIRDDLQNNPNAITFHLQVQRRGVGPQNNHPAPINQGNQVTITVHPFNL